MIEGGVGFQVGDYNEQHLHFHGPGSTWAAGEPRSRLPADGSPYRGLAAFETDDQEVFFGRDAATREVIARLSACAGYGGILVVSGVSGAGKSSLLRAGLLPRLREDGLSGLPGARDWPCLLFSPGAGPLEELATQVAALAGVSAATAAGELAGDPQRFRVLARQAVIAQEKPDHPGGRQRLIIFIDQFEQLFTQCADERQRRDFLTALHSAASGEASGAEPTAIVVLGVRADFEARCAEYPSLAAAIQGRYLLMAMPEVDLELAITEPARRAGARVDEALTSRLLREVRERRPGGADSAGVLPLLSYALAETWRRHAGDVLTLADYRATGGVESAVATAAGQAYGSLTEGQRETARRVFLSLVATSADGTDTAVPVSRAELEAGDDEGNVRTVLEIFAEKRLLTLTADGAEVSHEALLSAWPLLHDTWLAESHADRIVRTQLRTAAADWDDHGRDSAYLYRGAQLAVVREADTRWAADAGRYPALTGTDRDFMHAANHAASRVARQRRIIAAVLVLLLFASLAGAAIAINAARTARQQAALAASGQLAVQSEAFDTTDPVTAALLAAASWRIDPSNPAALESLLKAYAQPDRATLSASASPVNGVAYSRDGRLLATTSRDGTIRLWGVSTHAQIGAPITVPSGSGGGIVVDGVAFSPDGKTLATADRDGTVRLWGVSTHAQIGAPITLPGGSDGVFAVAFSPDGTTLATGDGDGTARLWGVSTHTQIGAPIAVPGGNSINGVAFSPDGTTLATADGDRTARLWGVSTRAQIGAAITVPGNSLIGVVDGVAFSPDGTTLATADGDGTARLWGVSTRAQIGVPITVPGGGNSGEGVFGVAFSPDGTTLATADGDGTARLWAISIHAQIGAPIAVPGGGNSVAGVAFSPDGTTLATADGDGTVRLWNVSTRTQIGAPITVPGGGSSDGVFSVAFSPDGKTLATVNRDRTARLWNVSTRAQIGAPITIPSGNIVGDGVLGVVFSPDGTTLAIADGDGTARLWNVSTRAQIGAPIIPGGSNGGVNWVAFSPDGTTLATADHDGTVWLWNVSTRAQIGAPITVPAAAATMALAEWGSARTVSCWPPSTATGRSGSGTSQPTLRSAHPSPSPAAVTASLTGWRSARTARPWPLPTATEQPGYGTWRFPPTS